MKRQHRDIERLRDGEALAGEKAKRWGQRAIAARQAGRQPNANRCEDKARDWSSRARQMERQRRDLQTDE